jgi:GT2 family glycosyltransferase
MHKQNFEFLKNSTLIIIVTYRHPELIKLSLKSVIEAIECKENTYVVIIDNHGNTEITEHVLSLISDKIFAFPLPFNFGKALAANFFMKEYITTENLPKTIVSIDPDIVFSKNDFSTLIEASQHLPNCGMIGMRYTKNNCNPERNLYFKPKKITGTNNKDYYLSVPFMCTVAGPIFAVSGDKVYYDCGNELFPKKYIKVYGGDDSAIYAKLRKRYINGYLEGTEVTHMASGAHICLPNLS